MPDLRRLVNKVSTVFIFLFLFAFKSFVLYNYDTFLDDPMLFSSNTYSLRKSRKTLHYVYRLYKRKKPKLSHQLQENFETHLIRLQEAINNKEREVASEQAKKLDQLAKAHLPKTFFEQTVDLIFALAFALVVAVIIRQMWFEFYVIPTGSMRPTFKEKDYLVVSKTAFGINTPLQMSHLYFDSNLLTRGSIVIFSGKNMDIRDVDTTYFLLFPGKKQYIKRLIGKPGDTLYFYGGLLYGIDKEGNEITEFYQKQWFEKIEHIPFLSFEGKVVTAPTANQGVFSPAVLYQTNEPVAKLFASNYGKISGEMIPKNVANYGDLWGFKNFAMASLVTEDEAVDLGFSPTVHTPLYLKLRHHPTFQPARLIRDEYGRMRPALSFTTSLLPLSEEHMSAIFKHLYTCRFVVKNGTIYRYGMDLKEPGYYQPKIANVPDGTYEFQDGILYEISWGAIPKKLPQTHPLYENNLARLQLFYNLGIEFDNHFIPTSKNQLFNPSRYAYFRNGDLYLMGYPIISKGDNTLQPQENALAAPFADLGPPLKADGTLDKELIRKNGLVIPDRMYLVLGDNHAMSADSRVFGFVPEENIRGGASFIFWPPSSRWGTLMQPTRAWLTVPNVTVWILFIVIVSAYSIYYRRKWKKPLKF